jgi:putative glutamine amidotransferase
MQKPVIGITTYGRDENKRFTLPAVYVDAVRRAGGIPLLIPPGESDLTLLLDVLDGVILAGGGDIDPQQYNGQRHETNYMLDAERDTSELDLARILIREDLPTLGICRGTQIINVALGGTLIEHIPDVVGEDVLHRVVIDANTRKPIAHEVRIDPTSRLAGIIGQTSVAPASWHHQAILQPAPGLQVVASAPDGTIEAVEKPDHPWLIAVQWHPEITAADEPDQQHIFDELIAAAQRRMVSKSSYKEHQ